VNLAIAKSRILDVVDYPKPGITFKDITPLLADAATFNYVIATVAKNLQELEIDIVAGVEARGFIIGAALANQLKKGFVPIRKPGKLPRKTIRREYQLEYGSDALEIHNDLIVKNSKVLIVDDVLATGGTAVAAGQLILDLESQVVGFAFLFAIEGLAGSDRIRAAGFSSFLEILFR
jgi:adenine phosphoribosyltransferase